MAPENVKVILGDLFSTAADAVVIPLSTSGTISDTFRRGLLDVFNYELPEIMPFMDLGSVDVSIFENRRRKNNRSRDNYLLFVSCVDGTTSSYDAIERIMDGIVNFCLSNPNLRYIAMPLIGTGAGNLLPSAVYRIIEKRFQRVDFSVELAVYIPDESKYRQVMNSIVSSDGEQEEKGYKDMNIFFNYSGNKYIYLFEVEVDKWGEYEGYFERGIWVNTFKNNIINVKAMEVGSPLFLKTFERAEDGRPGIRLHAAGIIRGNREDGLTLEVDWVLKKMDFFVRTDHPYDQNTGKVGEMNGKKILAAVGDWEVFKQGLLARKSEKAGNETTFAVSAIADIKNDEDRGIDYLDIVKDYTAFAKIIAARDFVPPLSIALFGKWGAGKSFFMKKLDEQVRVYSENGTSEFYCTGIAQIHFNAWSYMDANLWASIVSKIFEGLYAYISGYEHSDEEIRLISESLNKKLIITSEELSVIEKEKRLAEKDIYDFEKEKKDLEKVLEAKILEIEGNSLKHVLAEIDRQFNVSEKLTSVVRDDEDVQMSLDKIKQVVPEKYYKNPAEAYERAKSAATFLREFFDKEKIVLNLVVITLIILGIIFMPMLVGWGSGIFRVYVLPQVQTLLFLLTLLIPVWNRLKSTFNKISPIVAAFWKVKEMYRLEIENAKDGVVQREKVLNLEISFAEEKVRSLDQKIMVEKEVLRELTFKMEHAIATQTLYSFVEKRCNSDEYQKHLGIVSIIRKDFEVLSNLFVTHKREVADADTLEFRKLFKRPLERIVLYIDDLDRCPEERVVEVLEAVNLLMAFPLFVVVVGVDPRWVRKALDVKYRSQFLVGKDTKSDGDEISASDYLEKIFQVPFHLKQASDDTVKVMLRSLLKSDVENDTDNSNQGKDFANRENVYVNEGYVNEGFVGNSADVTLFEKAVPRELPEENLVLSEFEIESIEHISGILGSNPRGIKRFVNIYKIVRAHEGLSYMSADREKEFLVVMLLLALYNGKFKKLGVGLKDFLGNELYADDTISRFLDISSTGEFTAELVEMRTLLEKTPIGDVMFKEPVKTFSKQNEFIRRFTFDVG